MIYQVNRFRPAGLGRDAFMLTRCVVRRGSVFVDHGFQLVRPTLELLRREIPPGLNLSPPMEGDSPTLVETWM